MANCSKGSLEKKNVVDTFSKETTQVLKASSTLELRQSYILLQTKDKIDLWNTKWSSILKNDNDKLTEAQKDIIKSIQNFVNKETLARLFAQPSLGEKFMNDNLAYFQKNFTNNELYLITECPYYEENFSITKADEYIKKLSRYPINTINRETTIARLATDTCECYYSLSCGWDRLCDTSDDCKTITGCGIVGSSNCTGMCS